MLGTSNREPYSADELPGGIWLAAAGSRLPNWKDPVSDLAPVVQMVYSDEMPVVACVAVIQAIKKKSLHFYST